MQTKCVELYKFKSSKFNLNSELDYVFIEKSPVDNGHNFGLFTNKGFVSGGIIYDFYKKKEQI
jgi:hypothetical protein